MPLLIFTRNFPTNAADAALAVGGQVLGVVELLAAVVASVRHAFVPQLVVLLQVLLIHEPLAANTVVQVISRVD
jgi:hypothetical protein